MPNFFVKSDGVEMILRARSSETAMRRFMARYPALAELNGLYVMKWGGPPYLASPRGEIRGGRR
ncbi:MAG: hypothetical protein ABIJ47_01580 [Candidatus Bathyarchaeota archaeon]